MIITSGQSLHQLLAVADTKAIPNLSDMTISLRALQAQILLKTFLTLSYVPLIFAFTWLGTSTIRLPIKHDRHMKHKWILRKKVCSQERNGSHVSHTLTRWAKITCFPLLPWPCRGVICIVRALHSCVVETCCMLQRVFSLTIHCQHMRTLLHCRASIFSRINQLLST